MSFVITVKVPGDTEAFQKALVDRADEFSAIGAKAKTLGAVHHRFAIGDGFVLAVDEWETAEAFEAFFAEPAMQQFVGEIGAQGPPDIVVAQAVASPDEF